MNKIYESPVAEVISFTALEQMAALDDLKISLENVGDEAIGRSQILDL